MVNELNLRILPRQAYNEQSILAYLREEKGIKAGAVRVLRRSIDARQRTIYVNLTVRAYIGEEPPLQDFEPYIYKDVSNRPSVVVVGAGPGGLFAALRLIELGLKPIVVERGKDVRERKKEATASSTRAARSAATPTASCKSSCSTEPAQPSSPTPIRISAPTACRASSRTCARPSLPVVAKFTSRPR